MIMKYLPIAPYSIVCTYDETLAACARLATARPGFDFKPKRGGSGFVVVGAPLTPEAAAKVEIARS